MKIYLRSFQNYNLIQTHENVYASSIRHILLESPSPFPSPLVQTGDIGNTCSET